MFLNGHLIGFSKDMKLEVIDLGIFTPRRTSCFLNVRLNERYSLYKGSLSLGDCCEGVDSIYIKNG
jgi:hypothetical protein